MLIRFTKYIKIRSLTFSIDNINEKLDADQKSPYKNVFIQ